MVIINKGPVPCSTENYMLTSYWDSLSELLSSFILENILPAIYLDWDFFRGSLLMLCISLPFIIPHIDIILPKQLIFSGYIKKSYHTHKDAWFKSPKQNIPHQWPAGYTCLNCFGPVENIRCHNVCHGHVIWMSNQKAGWTWIRYSKVQGPLLQTWFNFNSSTDN